tara:strand:- start:5921 stop:6997 length:1077 start_codon:yes stop_codon:yes gene_type:complete
MNTTNPSCLVVHLIPTNAIGGVEIAAASIESGQHGALYLEKYFLASNPSFDNSESKDCYGPEASLNNFRVYLAAIRRVLRTKPDLIVASLWRSVLVMIICKLLRPSLKTVVFLHNTDTAHQVDRVINAIGVRLATQVWTDSNATFKARLGPKLQQKGKVISFLLDQSHSVERSAITPNFIFWGRLRKQKNVSRSVKLFRKIHEIYSEASFRIIGPDGGDETNVASTICNLELKEAISMMGPMAHPEISDASKSASFYLQTSDHEGMSMAVVEAMQFGLIPVVTPVGEIAHYCKDGVNAIFIKDDESVVAAIKTLLDDPERGKAIAKSAIDTWRGVSLYREDFVRFSCELLACHINQAD